MVYWDIRLNRNLNDALEKVIIRAKYGTVSIRGKSAKEAKRLGTFVVFSRTRFEYHLRIT
jgi:hypothetical protein